MGAGSICVNSDDVDDLERRDAKPLLQGVVPQCCPILGFPSIYAYTL